MAEDRRSSRFGPVAADSGCALVVPSTHGVYLGEVAAGAGDAAVTAETLPFTLRFLDRD
jgi:hypothetical protein